MNPLYTAGINLYGCAVRVASWRSPKVKDMLRGQAETIARIERARKSTAPDGFDVWFHAASLGEFEQARPMIDRLLAENPEVSILLSFFSPSGYNVRHSYNPRVTVVYLPFDTPANVESFLDAAQPQMAVFVKYEFWGNYLDGLCRRGIPTYLISAIFRPSQIFFKPWGGMFRRMLHCFTHIFVQDEASCRLLEKIGVNNVTVAGDTRFDRVSAIRRTRRAIDEAEAFAGSGDKHAFTIVFGSSWPADEQNYFPWLMRHPGVKAIIAPHEFDRERIHVMEAALGPQCTITLSQLREMSPDEASRAAAAVRYLIVDSFGLLSSLYAYGDMAYVGGGFGVGIHNINEAATYGIPVVFGPHFRKFKEAGDLISLGGAFSSDSAKGIEDILDSLLSDDKKRRTAGKMAGDYIAQNIGATDTIMAHIFPQN